MGIPSSEHNPRHSHRAVIPAQAGIQGHATTQQKALWHTENVSRSRFVKDGKIIV